MATIRGVYRKVSALNTDVVIEEVFVSNEKVIADENREQLYQGLDKNGNHLKKYRNRQYAIKKAGMNSLPGFGNPDYFLTGDFYRGISVKIEGDVIRTILSDPKSFFLIDKNPDIIGLGGPFRQDLVNKIRPEIIKGIRNKIGL